MSSVTVAGFENSVKRMFKSGCSIKEIAACKERSVEEIEDLVVKLHLVKYVKTRSSEILGSKTEPYYENEDQMLYPPEYKFEDLSQEEKDFYESRTDM
jgi:hypothetical protein